ncbi:hypothetical protein [Bacillus cereus]|uniref:hypothetical protein n=1 Tax=Bacillus cereus TaxID=1396 RepID=UPI0018F3BD84|nr:hypothetical protein [Bacillus cereus]MBJ7967905.1 hypothetical protein [Bacillus cereus]MBJ8004292.1 hypothetical protein [Bacillus cereus]
MKFIEQHRNYQTYESNEYYTNEIPREFLGAIKGYINGHITDAEEFKQIISIIAKYVPCEPGTNWGFPWLISDLDDVIWNLYQKKRFPKFMDCIGEIAENFFQDKLDDINEMLKDASIGYTLSLLEREGSIWEVRESIENRTETVSEALEGLLFTYENTNQHLNQAKEQLTRMETPRARKDALRDCVSALESHLKYLSGMNDFRASVAELVRRDIGSKKVIKDALTIWTYVHEGIPDVRHGHTEDVPLSSEEALYWIDRIMALIKYLSRITQKNV